ncbi:beta-class carbonic anhydrase [Massilibacterium senegalense]|uniref:beta-class carbonic anhydrase n=1 Tax=Massilibacterium senegalense TaxID=1632858 RepID=UPI000783B62C|nr:carbonic anhydrase [Massilibacterium senegalense]
MTLLNDMLAFNQTFVEKKEYEKFTTTKFPNKKLVIFSCMDTRLVELLPKALNLHNGDVKIIKNAGAVVSHPFGSIMRSILVAVYELKAEEVCVIGHDDCGMSKTKPEPILKSAVERGISQEIIDTLTNSGIDLNTWLNGFDSVDDSVKNSVSMIKKHPLLPTDVPVHGLVMNPSTGQLRLVVDGYQK